MLRRRRDQAPMAVKSGLKGTGGNRKMRAFILKLLLDCLVVLIAVGTFDTIPAFAQQSGGGAPQQQISQVRKYQWTALFLAIENALEEPVEIHIKYRAQPCRNCAFIWFPCPPDRPGDLAAIFQPGERMLLGDEEGKPVPIAGFLYWAVGLKSGRENKEHVKEENAISLVSPTTGLVITDSDERPTYTLHWGEKR